MKNVTEKAVICMMKIIVNPVRFVALIPRAGGRWKNITARITAGTHAKKDAGQ